MHDTDLDLIM